MSTERTQFGDVSELCAVGRFKEAYQHLKVGSSGRQIGERALFDLWAAEILFELGDVASSIRKASAVIGSPQIVPELNARAHRVMARCLFSKGDFHRSTQHLRTAAASAKGCGAQEVLAKCGLTELLFGVRPFEAARTDFLELRRLIARIGDAHLMIQLRLCVAHREARIESVREAEKHLDTAVALLERYPNVWLSGWIDLDRSALAAMRGDLDGVLEHGERALQSAMISGHFRNRIAALINTSHALAARGEHQEAHNRIDAVVRSTQDHPHLQMAALDSRANLFIAAGDSIGAHRVFDEMARASERLEIRLHWDALTESYSRARLAVCCTRWDEAKVHVTAGLQLAKNCSDRLWARRFELLLAKCDAHGRAAKSASDVLFVTSDQERTLELTSQWHAAVASLHRQSSAQQDALARACRIADGLGNAALRREVSAGFDFADSQLGPDLVPGVSDALGLIEVGSHPQILAREAIATLSKAGSVPCCLSGRRGDDVRILETRGWDERQALAAAKKADPAATIDCGTYRDEALQVIVELPQDLERRCAFVAIKKLVATALTLEQYRREEKQRAALWPAEALDGDPDCLWISEPIAEVVRVAKRIGPTPLSVLITGESGTGKEMLARTIHRASERGERIMLPFNCTAVPREMLESQLFGYRKGAFTGADTAFAGVIRSAEGGTLFLDEIADVPLDLQPKLLRFLETHEIHPLGEPHPITVDVRVIAATNANLEQLVAQGRFREDLYYRLNVVRLRLPPLRERREEIPALVEHYVQRYADQQKKGRLTLSDEALEYLLLYAWPGNIRQLANEVNRMVAMAEPDTTLTSAHLSAEIQATRRTIPAAAAPDSDMRLSLDEPLPDAVERLERLMVKAALDRANGRVEEAARILGISRKGLFLKRRRWGMSAS